MRFKLKLAFLVFTAVVQTEILASSENDVVTFAGTALSKNQSNVFYVEAHKELVKNNKHVQTEIIYFDSKGKKIGYKTLNFSNLSTSPTYILEDERAFYREGAEVTNNMVSVYYQYTKKDKNPNSKTFYVPNPIVIDGGFNYFVKQNWTLLMQGKILTFNFVSPSKMDYFTLRISKKQDLYSGGKSASLIYLELDNIFLRWLLSPIKITYDNSTKRIISYEGISNLSNENGNNENVTLMFPNLGP